MGGGFKIAEVSGIAIRIHVTFFLILILGAAQWGGITGTVEGALFGVVLTVLLFVCVTLHELGHSLVALRFGIPVREITLWPLGGIAQITKNPDKPLHELLISIAGPLVNVLIAAILFVAVGGMGGLRGFLSTGRLLEQISTPSLQTLLLWLFTANISLAVFNLIPAFPLDGGRVLRALLSMVISYRRATRIATVVGQIAALGLGVWGLLQGNIVLVFIAVFIFFGAGQENAVAESKTLLTTLRVGDAYNRHALTLAVGDRVSKVVDFLLTSHQPDFAVMQGSNIIGIITRNDVLRALANSTVDLFVTEVMDRDFLKVDASKTLQEVSELMTQAVKRVAAVYSGNMYLGLTSAEDISEAFAVLAFQQRQREARQAQQAQSNQV